MTADDPARVTEQLRPVEDTPHPTRLLAELWQAMRAGARGCEAERDLRRTREAGHRRRFASLVADEADALHQLRRFIDVNTPDLETAGLTDQLAVLHGLADAQDAALRRVGVRMHAPLQEEFDPVATPWIQVRHVVVDPQVQVPTVIETLLPAITLDTGELIRPGAIRLALPEEARAEADQVTESPDGTGTSHDAAATPESLVRQPVPEKGEVQA